jgi:hypothetical protein
MRSLDLRVPIALQIPVAQIIAQDDHDVGSLILLGMDGKAGKDGGETSEKKKAHSYFHSRMQNKNREKVAMKFAGKTISLIIPRNFQ